MSEEGPLSFVVFSDDWGVHPSSCQHLFREISHQHNVLWVNTVGMRRPRLSRSDFMKAGPKLRRMFGRGTRDVAPHTRAGDITVLQPIQLPMPTSRLVGLANAWSAYRAVAGWLADRNINDPIVVSTVPNAVGAIRRIPSRLRVYYCVDDFGLWPGHDRRLVQKMEADLVASSGLLISPTDALARRSVFGSRRVHLLPHGVDIGHFSASRTPLPTVESLPRPRAGFFGLLDERIDRALIVTLAKMVPDWSFVFAGPVSCDLEDWAELSNVHCIGPIAYSDLPRLLAGIDVLILPYKVNELTHSLAPLKLREYIASGLPVVTCAIAAAETMQPWLNVSRSAADWVAALVAARREDVHARRRAAMQALSGESWQHRATEFVALCSNCSAPGAA